MKEMTDQIFSISDIFGGLSAFLIFLCFTLLYARFREKGTLNRKRLVIFFIYKTLFTLFFVYSALSGGDTIMYYACTIKLSDAGINQFIEFFTDFTPQHANQSYLSIFGQYSAYMTNAANAMTVKIGFLVGYIFFHSYISICLIFSYFSFFGTWFMYKGLSKMFPHYNTEIVILCFFLPSVCFWSSGYLKDPITYGSFCFLLYFIIQIIYYKIFKIKYFLLGLIFIFLIYEIKGYILITLMGSLILVFLFEHPYFKKRRKLTYLIIFIIILVFLVLSQSIFASLIEETKDGTEFYAQADSGSYVKFFEYDTSIPGVFKMIFLSFFGVFYRPFLWEVKSFSMLLAAVESLFLSFITLKALINYKLWKIKLKANSFLIFCILFSFLFSIIVGFSTFNFGSVSRYKMPAMPLIFIFFFMLIKKKNKKLKN